MILASSATRKGGGGRLGRPSAGRWRWRPVPSLPGPTSTMLNYDWISDFKIVSGWGRGGDSKQFEWRRRRRMGRYWNKWDAVCCYRLELACFPPSCPLKWFRIMSELASVQLKEFPPLSYPPSPSVYEPRPNTVAVISNVFISLI